MKRYETALAVIGSMMLITSTAIAQRTSVSAGEVNGTYEKKFTGKFRGNANVVRILAVGGGKLRFDMDLLFPYLLSGGERSAHLGDLDDTAVISGDTAVFTSAELPGCRITMKFMSPGVLDVKQKGSDAECGFGHNVIATGRYRKVSSKKPEFPPDSR